MAASDAEPTCREKCQTRTVLYGIAAWLGGQGTLRRGWERARAKCVSCLVAGADKRRCGVTGAASKDLIALCLRAHGSRRGWCGQAGAHVRCAAGKCCRLPGQVPETASCLLHSHDRYELASGPGGSPAGTHRPSWRSPRTADSSESAVPAPQSPSDISCGSLSMSFYCLYGSYALFSSVGQLLDAQLTALPDLGSVQQPRDSSSFAII